jgi:hypothetical protein
MKRLPNANIIGSQVADALYPAVQTSKNADKMDMSICTSAASSGLYVDVAGAKPLFAVKVVDWSSPSKVLCFF